MAYINKTNFKIVSNIIDRIKDDYFECDDNIAISIALLNKKGYKTLYSCAGHPFPGLAEVFNEDPENTNDESNTIVYIPSTFYITFEKAYDFPELPLGFEYTENEDGTSDIYCFKSAGIDYSFEDLVYSFERCEDFYDWVLGLEPINKFKHDDDNNCKGFKRIFKIINNLIKNL